jgi:hypothetical protein
MVYMNKDMAPGKNVKFYIEIWLIVVSFQADIGVEI